MGFADDMNAYFKKGGGSHSDEDPLAKPQVILYFGSILISEQYLRNDIRYAHLLRDSPNVYFYS